MNRLILIGILLITSNVWADEVAELTVWEDDLDLNLIYSEEFKNISIAINQDDHSFSGSLMLKNTPFRSFNFSHLNYSYDWQFTNYFSNVSSLALGYFGSSSKRYVGGVFDHQQILGGVQNYFIFESSHGKTSSTLGLGVAAVKDFLDEENDWDNFKAEIYFQNTLPLWITDFRIASKLYNTERYFFIEKRNLMSFKTGPNFSGEIWQFIPFIGLDMDYMDDQLYRRIRTFGTIFNFDISSKSFIQLRGGYSEDMASQVYTSTASIALRRPSQSFEIYALSRNGEPWQQERTIGIRIDITYKGTGNPENKRQNLFSTENYREPARQSDFYDDYGFQDATGLSLYEQADRLNSLRLRNEWSGTNLRYHSYGGFGARNPNDVYSSRRGDCDDQAWLNAWMDRRNGYPAYLLIYWPQSGYIAHGVEIVQDPRTGRWFFDEYGVLQEIKVDRNAPIQTVVEEALKQCAKFSALPINYHDVIYWVQEPMDDPAWLRFLGWSGMSDFQSTAGERPRIEKGYEVFVGPDALWR